MAYCINTKHPDFIKLVEQSGLKPQIVSARVSLYMKMNNTENFPSVETLLWKTDLKLREKYFYDGSVQSVSTILNRLSGDSSPLAVLANHLKKFVKDSFLIKLSETATIPYLNKDNQESHAAGLSLWEKGKEGEHVVIAEYTSFRGSSEATILHEILHQLSQYQLLDKTTTNYKKFEEAYQHAKQELINGREYDELSNDEKEVFYALKNVDEFLVALFTDARFIKALSDIPPMKESGKFANLLQEVFNILLKALRISENSPFYNEAFSIATNILEDQSIREQSRIDNENREEEDPFADSQFNLNLPTSPQELLNELKSLGIITKYKGYFMIKKGGSEIDSKKLFDAKNEEISKRLGTYPELIFSSTRSKNGKSWLVSAKYNGSSSINEGEIKTPEEEKRLIDVLDHLKKIFPGIEVFSTTREKLKEYFPTFSEEELDKINAFYSAVKNRVVIANPKAMTIETLVEEFLHPFVNMIEGTPLFNTMMKEAKDRAKEHGSEFNILYEKIKKGYKKVYNGNQNMIDKEFLTQAISIIYARQYNNKLDNPFSKLVARFKEKILSLLSKVGVNFSSITDLKDLRITTLVELMQQEDFRMEIKNTNTKNEKVWFNLQEEADAEIDRVLQSKSIDSLRQKYNSLFDELTKDVSSTLNDKEAVGNATLTKLINDLGDKETIASVAEYAQKMLTYYTETSTLVKVLFNELKKHENNKTLSEDELANLAFKATKAANVLLPELAQFYEEVKGLDRKSNPLINQIYEAIGNVADINRKFKDLSIRPTARALAKSMEISEQELQGRLDKDILELQETLKLKDPTSESSKKIKEKIKFLQKVKSFTASEDNLVSHLSGTSRLVEGQGNVQTFNRVDYDPNKKGEVENIWDTLDSLWLAGMSSGNASVASVATFIKNTIQEGIQNYIDNNRQKIQSLKEEFFQQNPGVSEEDLENAFKKFTGVFENHYIDAEGNLITGESTKEVALLSEGDTYAFNNDLLALKHKLSLESDPDKRDLIKKDIQAFIKEHAESLYTEEFDKIQDLLIPEARQAREEIFNKINRYNAIREKNYGKLEEEDLQELEDLYNSLDKLESIFNDDGSIKPIGSIERDIAESLKAFKKARRDEDVVEYSITKSNQALWALEKKEIDEGYANGKVSQQDRDLWYKTNVKTIYTKDYYVEVKHIWEDISRILSLIPHDEDSEKAKAEFEKYRAELQDLSKGYKDSNGYIKADSELAADGHMDAARIEQVRKLDEKLIEIKKYITKYSGLSEIEKNQLFSLKQQLSQAVDFTKKENIKRQIAFLEQKMDKSGLSVDQTRRLLNNFRKLEALSTEENSPYYNSRYEIERAKYSTLEEFEESDWFKDNHIQKDVYEEHFNEDGDSYFLPAVKPVPLSVWTKSIPVQEQHIEKESPSNVWTTYKIASGLSETEKKRLEFLKSNLSSLTEEADIKASNEEIEKLEKKSKKNYFNPNSKTINGKMKPKASSSKYSNKAYASLSPKDKEFLEKYRALYYEAQRLLPTSQRNGDMLPGIEKHALDRGISKFLTTSLPLLWVKLKSIFAKSARLEEEPEYIKKPKNNYLTARYRGRVKEDRISYNLFDSLGDYSVEANIFNRTFDNQKTILTAQHLYNENRRGTKAAKQISNLVDMLVFSEYDIRKMEIAKRLLAENQKMSALLMLSVRPLNAIKNATVGTISSLIYGNSPHYKIKDYRRALYKVKNILFESVIHDARNPAKKNELGLKIEKFNLIQGSLRDHIGKGFMNTITKGIFSREMLTKGRIMGEYLIQTALGEAISQSTLVPLKGVPTPIMDVYEVKDNVLVLKEGAYTDDQGNRWTDEMIKAKEQQFMNIVEKYNVEINGNYSKLNKADIEREWAGKFLLFMQKYIPTFLKERIGKESIDHITGQIKIGTYRALLELVIDLVKDLKSIKSTYQNQTSYNKYRANIAMRESGAWVALSILGFILSNMLAGEDDEDPTTWLGWNILNLINQTNAELTTMNPFDAVHDYLPLRKDNKTRELQLSSAGQWWDKIKNQMFWRRISGSAYVLQNVLTPMLIDGINYSLEGDVNQKGNKAIYHKEYGVHKQGDVKFFADLQKLIPGVKGAQDMLHPKEATDAWVYMNTLH